MATATICYLWADGLRYLRTAGHGVAVVDAPTDGQLIIVLDAADETQTAASLPLVRGAGDAGVLHRRRLEREFPGVSLKAVLPVRRRPADALADVVMVAADLTGAHAGTIGELAGRHALRGVYTPSLLAAHWMREARLADRQALILLPTPAGYRLIFVDQCCPVLSRLIPGKASESLAVEIGRTIQYLQNTQRVSREARVTLWFWGLDDAAVAASLPAGDNFEVGAAPRVPGIPDPEAAGFDALLQLAAIRPPSRQLAHRSLRAGWFAQVTRRAGFGLAAGVLAAGVVTGGLLHARVQQQKLETESVAASEAGYLQQRQALEESLAASGLAIDQLLAWPQAASTIRAAAVAPQEALGLVADLFSGRSSLLVQQLAFQSAPLGVAAADGSACASDATAGGAASLGASFRLVDGLDVRSSSAALESLNKALTQSGKWKSSEASAALGRAQPVTVHSDAQAGSAESEWSICLLRAPEAG